MGPYSFHWHQWWGILPPTDIKVGTLLVMRKFQFKTKYVNVGSRRTSLPTWLSWGALDDILPQQRTQSPYQYLLWMHYIANIASWACLLGCMEEPPWLQPYPALVLWLTKMKAGRFDLTVIPDRASFSALACIAMHLFVTLELGATEAGLCTGCWFCLWGYSIYRPLQQCIIMEALAPI